MLIGFVRDVLIDVLPDCDLAVSMDREVLVDIPLLPLILEASVVLIDPNADWELEVLLLLCTINLSICTIATGETFIFSKSKIILWANKSYR